MTTTPHANPSDSPRATDRTIVLALSLAQAEQAIHDFTSGQVDAIVDPDGRAYLLRPAQERLRADEVRLRAILDSTGDGIFVINRGGLIVSQNRAAARLLGDHPDEPIGRSFFEFVDPGELHHFHSAFFNVIENFRADASVDFHLRAHDGSFRWIEATVSKLRDDSAPGVVLTCRDHTLRRPISDSATLREATLTAALLDRDRFLAVLAHELRAPLSPMLLGLAEVEEDALSPSAKATLEMIRRNIGVESRLIGELVDFTTLGQHKVRLRPESLDVHEAIGFVLEICRREIDAAQIEVSLALHATDSIVVADSVRLQQVMWNLVKNAVKFSQAGSQLSIATSNGASGWVVIEFADQGIGIESHLLPFVFDPFQQGSLTGVKRNDGLGLGLYIAKGLAEAQGGTLTALSEGQGKGARFRFALRTASPDPQAGRHPQG